MLKYVGLLNVIWGLFCAIGWSAEIHTEHFAAGAADWNTSGALAMSVSNEALLGAFPCQGFPAPEVGAFVATNISSGGAFTGDYVGAGIGLVGLSFQALDVLPSDLLLRWHSTSNVFMRSLSSYVKSTGTWYHFSISLAAPAEGRWLGGGDSAFQAGLGEVQFLELRLSRNGGGAQRYLLDEFFVDTLPAVDGVMFTNGGMPVVSWVGLRSNVSYIVESAIDPSTEWSAEDEWLASTTTCIWTGVATGTRQCYRLTQAECTPR